MKTSTQTNSLSPNRANTSDLIKQPNVRGRRLSPDDVRKVAPALENYTQDILYGEVWNRAGLSRRDRSIVTVAALITRGQAGALDGYRAMDERKAIKVMVKP